MTVQGHPCRRLCLFRELDVGALAVTRSHRASGLHRHGRCGRQEASPIDRIIRVCLVRVHEQSLSSKP